MTNLQHVKVIYYGPRHMPPIERTNLATNVAFITKDLMLQGNFYFFYSTEKLLNRLSATKVSFWVLFLAICH